MSPMFMSLINELLSDPEIYEVQSYTILKGETLSYGSALLNIHNNRYLIHTKDCSSCDSAHVNCRYMETIELEASHALKTLEGWGS